MTLRIGIIGCGQMGHRRAEGVRPGPDVITHVFDPDQERAAWLAETAGGRCTATAGELITQVDAVVVATPNAFLAPYAEMSLERGRPVLVEKPGAADSATMRRLTAYAAARGVPFQVGYSLVHYEAVREFMRATAGIGELAGLRGSYGHGGRPGMGREWRADPRLSGGGELLDQGVHLIHLALLLLGPVTRVRAQISSEVWGLPVEDTAALLLDHERGSAVLSVSWCFWKNEFRLDVTGTHGSVHLDGLGGSYGESRLTARKRHADRPGPPDSREVEISARNTWESEWACFSQLVRDGGAGNGELAASVLQVVEAARADAVR